MWHYTIGNESLFDLSRDELVWFWLICERESCVYTRKGNDKDDEDGSGGLGRLQAA